jgi:hypothetical protein
MIAWLETLVRWTAGSLMAAFFGVFLFSMWVTLTHRYRPKSRSPEQDPPPDR